MMDIKEKELLELRSFTQKIETEVTMLLQSLQWDRKRILEGNSTSTCQYDVNHTIPRDNLSAHENSCFLRSLGYLHNEELLPDPPDDNAHTLVKFSNIEIEQIINEASKNDPLFQKGSGGVSHQPLSLSRLQLVYTADERRAIHNAVVAAVPSCHDLEDLALAGIFAKMRIIKSSYDIYSSTEDAKAGRSGKSRVEILAELRNMKRRRAKYRVAPKTKNYSDVLRDVIRTQMESYTEAIASTSVKEQNSDYDKCKSSSDTVNHNVRNLGGVRSRDHSEHRRENSAENRQSSLHYKDRTNRESRREYSSKRYESEDRSESRKRNESHRHKNQKGDKYNEAYKSTSGHSDRERHGGHSSHRRHDRQVDKIRSEDENGGRYDNKHSQYENYKRKSKDFNESDRKYESRRKEDRFIMQKIKVEPEEDIRNDKYERRKNDRSSKDRHESRKRKHKDDEYGRQSDDVKYKRYYEIKKEPI